MPPKRPQETNMMYDKTDFHQIKANMLTLIDLTEKLPLMQRKKAVEMILDAFKQQKMRLEIHLKTADITAIDVGEAGRKRHDSDFDDSNISESYGTPSETLDFSINDQKKETTIQVDEAFKSEELYDDDNREETIEVGLRTIQSNCTDSSSTTLTKEVDTESKKISDLTNSEQLHERSQSGSANESDTSMSHGSIVLPECTDPKDKEVDEKWDGTAGNTIHLAVELADGTVQKIQFEVVASDDDTIQVKREDNPSKGVHVKNEVKSKKLLNEGYGGEIHMKKGKGRPKTGNVPPPVTDENGVTAYKCKECGQKVQTYHALIVHMRKHTGERPFACTICGKSFTTKGNMVAHLTSAHRDDKPWQCETCGKYFKEKKVLKVHQRIHTGEKPFECEVCKKAFTQGSTLKEHMLLHEGKKPHLCDFCGRGFRNTSNLKLHKRRHLCEKNHICELCDKAFVSSGALQKHRISHTGDRKHVCEICNKCFANLSSLQQHIRTNHSNVKAYACEVCLKTFATMGQVLIHSRTHQLERTVLDVPGENLSVQNLPGKNLPVQSLPVSNLPGKNLAIQNIHGQTLAVQNLSGKNLAIQNIHGQNLSGQNIPGQSQSGQNQPGQNLSALNLPVSMIENSLLLRQSTNLDTVYLMSDDRLVDISKKSEDSISHVLVSDTVIEGNEYDNYHSLLITGTTNADLVLDSQTNNQIYQVMCVNQDTQVNLEENQEVVIQSQTLGSNSVT